MVKAVLLYGAPVNMTTQVEMYLMAESVEMK